MTRILRCLAALALLASVVQSVLACGFEEFWYENKSCCVPNTAPQTPSSPPPGKSCPLSTSESWYWSDERSCCLPAAPPQSNSTCQGGHWWDEKESSCFAPPSAPNGPGPSECSDDEFWYQPNACCLPHGRPSNPSTPPTGSDCPPSGWYWSDSFKCCIPSHPSPPPPQCRVGWEWIAGSHACRLIPTPPNQRYPRPSHGYSGHNRKKRTHKLRANSLCPNNLIACPVAGPFSDYECIDTRHDLRSCGGCSSIGMGQDCTAIRGAWNVGCESGHCTVYNCMAGYKFASNRTACIPL